MSTKCSLVPPTWRASMYAASFAEGSISAYSRSMTRTVSPTLMPAFELSAVTLAKSPCSAVTVSFRSLTFSSVSSAVIILVVDAGYRFSSAFFSYSTMSESGLMSRAAVAVTAGASLAAAVTSLSLSAVTSLEALLSAESVLPESVDEVSALSESVDEVSVLSESDWLDEVSLSSFTA